MYEKFIDIIKQNSGIITSKVALEKGISRTALKNMKQPLKIETQ